MSLISINIPNLISGVSQQADALRFASQAEESINAYPSLVDGLVKRPPTRLVGKIINGNAGDVKVHTINRDTTERYTAVFTSSGVNVFDMSGVARTVHLATGASSYLSTTPSSDIKCLTLADYTLVLNKSKTVSLTSDTVTARPFEAMVFVAQGAYNASYTIGLRTTPTASKINITHSSSDGTTVKTDAQSTVIAGKLRDGIVANSTLNAAFDVEVIGSTLYIKKKDNSDFDIVVGDSQSGSGLKLVFNEVQSFLDLPAEGKHGFVVKVAGEPDDEGDEYWIEFEASDGVSGTGIWKETVEPDIKYKFNSASLPHALVRLSNGNFVFTPLNGTAGTYNSVSYTPPVWGERLVGDEESNPDPSFVGRKLTDILFYRNRLGFLCDENVIFSEASEFFNFWRTTVTQLLDGDPIDVATSSSKVSLLFSGVPFFDRLILFSDQTQFSLQSVDNLTAKTVSIQNTTNFECSAACPPVAVGKNIYFAFNKDNFSGIQEYFLSPDTQFLDGIDVTAAIPSYISGSATKLAGSDNEQMLAVMSSGLTNGFYLYKYFFNGIEKLQSAWCKMTLSSSATIRNLDFIDNSLYLTIQRGTEGLFLERIDFQAGKTDSSSLYTTLLDRRITESTSGVTRSYNSNTGITTITLPYQIELARARVVTRTSGNTIGGAVIPRVVTTGEPTSSNTIQLKTDYSTTPLWIGENYIMEHTLGRVVVRAAGAKGNPTVVSAGKLILRRANILYDKTRSFSIQVTPFNNTSPTTYTYVCANQVTGTPTAAVGYDSLLDGTFRFPILSRNDKVTIKLVNDTPHPCSLLSMDIEAQYVSRSQRAG